MITLRHLLLSRVLQLFHDGLFLKKSTVSSAAKKKKKKKKKKIFALCYNDHSRSTPKHLFIKQRMGSDGRKKISLLR